MKPFEFIQQVDNFIFNSVKNEEMSEEEKQELIDEKIRLDH